MMYAPFLFWHVLEFSLPAEFYSGSIVPQIFKLEVK